MHTFNGITEADNFRSNFKAHAKKEKKVIATSGPCIALTIPHYIGTLACWFRLSTRCLLSVLLRTTLCYCEQAMHCMFAFMTRHSASMTSTAHSQPPLSSHDPHHSSRILNSSEGMVSKHNDKLAKQRYSSLPQQYIFKFIQSTFWT